MKKIIRLTESDLTKIIKRVITEEQESSCLVSAGFTKESIGGPMTKRYVYEKEHARTLYQINILNDGTTSKTLTKISGDKYEVCSSWSCDPNSDIGIIFSGCKQEKQMFY